MRTTLLTNVLAFLTVTPIYSQNSSLPASLPLNVSPSSTLIANASHDQVEEVTYFPGSPFSDLQLPNPIEEGYTITFWIRLNDRPTLLESSFGTETPVTLVDFFAANCKTSDGHCVIRVLGGKFSVTEENGGEWKSLRGYAASATPDTWCFLAYSRTSNSGTFYVNGDINLRSSSSLPAPNQLQTLGLGHFNRSRRLDGTILQPRVYDQALSHEQIPALYQNRPPRAR